MTVNYLLQLLTCVLPNAAELHVLLGELGHKGVGIASGYDLLPEGAKLENAADVEVFTGIRSDFPEVAEIGSCEMLWIEYDRSELADKVIVAGFILKVSKLFEPMPVAAEDQCVDGLSIILFDSYAEALGSVSSKSSEEIVGQHSYTGSNCVRGIEAEHFSGSSPTLVIEPFCLHRHEPRTWINERGRKREGGQEKGGRTGCRVIDGSLQKADWKMGTRYENMNTRRKRDKKRDRVDILELLDRGVTEGLPRRKQIDEAKMRWRRRRAKLPGKLLSGLLMKAPPTRTAITQNEASGLTMD